MNIIFHKNNNIDTHKILEVMQMRQIDYLLVNNTNIWLDETPDLQESAVYTLTGFTGDTGDALLYKDGKITLFVDGRYHIQAEQEVKDSVKVVKLQAGQRMNDEIVKHMYSNSTLAIVSKKVSYMRYNYLKPLLEKKNIKIEILDNDPINNYTKKRSKKFKSTWYLQKEFKPKQDTLITDLNEVSYLTGLRNFEESGSSKIYAKLFISKDGGQQLIKTQKEFEKFIEKQNKKEPDNSLAVDKYSISLYDYNLIENPVLTEDNEVAMLKAVKTNDEIVALKKAFEISDKALLEARHYIENKKAGSLSEYDIYKKLIKSFKKYGAVGISFEPIVAINKNSASAHYNQHSKDVYLNEGDLVLIDCGVYGKEGLATDTTRVFVKGQPNELQKQVYTQVLKAFLQAYNTTDKTGYDMHMSAYDALLNSVKANSRSDKSKEVEYFTFNHGLGHGIGISVHEFPPSLSKWEGAKQEILTNMCFTIEPGLYHKDHFGVRLENSFYRKGGKNVSLTKIGFEKKLIDFDILTEQERELLKDFALLG